MLREFADRESLKSSPAARAARLASASDTKPRRDPGRMCSTVVVMIVRAIALPPLLSVDWIVRSIDTRTS